MEETTCNIVYQCFCSLFMNTRITINIFSIFLLFIQSRENIEISMQLHLFYRFIYLFILDLVSRFTATIIQLLSVKVCYQSLPHYLCKTLAVES